MQAQDLINKRKSVFKRRVKKVQEEKIHLAEKTIQKLLNGEVSTLYVYPRILTFAIGWEQSSLWVKTQRRFFRERKEWEKIYGR
jgi:hypothetical protein